MRWEEIPKRNVNVGRGGNDTFGGACVGFWAWLVYLFFLLWGVLNIFLFS